MATFLQFKSNYLRLTWIVISIRVGESDLFAFCLYIYFVISKRDCSVDI